jgi:5'-nucleotidase
MIEKESRRIPSWARPWTIVNAGGARVGIIGLSTPDTPNVTMSINVAGLEFTDPVAATVEAARQLRERRVDAVVVIAHMGGRCSDLREPHVLDSCAANQEAMELLQRLPPGTVDGFFAGHTHAQMRHWVNGVPALQGAPFSREFSTLDLWIDVAADRVVRSEMRPHTMICSFVYEGTEECDPHTAPAQAKLVPRLYEGHTILPEPRVAATLEPYNRRVAAKRDAKVGIRVTDAFRRSHAAESQLGDLIADALREYAQTDFAFMNPGGIRADLPVGDLTYGEVFAVSPFDNYPASVTLTGAEVREVLRLILSSGRGVMQVSGLRYTADLAKDAGRPAGEGDPIVSITRTDGTPLDPEKLYTVAMPDFIAAGGDGVAPVLTKIPQNRIAISYLKPIRDALIDVLSRRPQPLRTFVDGRITILNRPAR